MASVNLVILPTSNGRRRRAKRCQDWQADNLNQEDNQTANNLTLPIGLLRYCYLHCWFHTTRHPSTEHVLKFVVEASKVFLPLHERSLISPRHWQMELSVQGHSATTNAQGEGQQQCPEQEVLLLKSTRR